MIRNLKIVVVHSTYKKYDKIKKYKIKKMSYVLQKLPQTT